MRFFARSLGVLVLFCYLALARPKCAHCQDDPFCLSNCAYSLLPDATTNAERAEILITLAKAWVLGRFQQGALDLLHEARSLLTPNEKALLAQALYWLGQAHHTSSALDSAAYYYQKLTSDPQMPPYWVAKAYLALAALSATQSPLKATSYVSKALDIIPKTDDPELWALAYNQLAFLKGETDPKIALQEAEKALDYAQKTHKPKLIASILANTASLYADLGQSQKAIALYKEALSQASDTVSLGQAMLGLAQLAFGSGDYPQATKWLNRLTLLSHQLPYEMRQGLYRLQAQVALQQGRAKEAIAFLEKALSEASLAITQAESNRLSQLEKLSKLREQRLQLRQLELSRERERLFYALLGTVGLIALGGIAYAYRSARKRALEEVAFRSQIETLNQNLQTQAEQLKRQNEELVRISEALTEALKDLEDSMQAARRLQDAITPPLPKLFPGVAVYHQPMQQVGGDFYTVAHDPLTGRYVLAIGDCTGHGVSGSILASIFAATIQNFFLQNPRQSGLDLMHRVHGFVQKILGIQATKDSLLIREGADLALLLIDPSKRHIEIVLAGRPMWIYDEEKGFYELEGGRRGLDSLTPRDYEFPVYQETIRASATYYLFTDGVHDVLNAEGKRWGIRRLRALLQDPKTVALPAEAQLQAIISAMRSWRQSAPINDDITLLILPGASFLADIYRNVNV